VSIHNNATYAIVLVAGALCGAILGWALARVAPMKTLHTGDPLMDIVLNPPTVAREALIDSLIVDIIEGVMVLAHRDGLPVTLEMATERARNIVCGLVTNYSVEPATEGRS
jgi:hypothetical protein